MKKFFYPKSLAVVGVSETPDNLARGIVSNLLQFNYQGKIFLVGARPGTAFDRPIFPSLRDLPEPVDLAGILAPARVIPALLRDCGELGISRVVVESAGFSEMGESGHALENEVRALLKQYRLRMIGPNGLGCLNMEIGMALSFAQVRPVPRLGHISIIAQSGGVATHLIAWMTREGLGLNKFLSLGNKLDVGENEALAYLLEDPGTAAIYVYLEGIEDGRGLLEVARRASKPVFLHAANVGPETAAIARSHTASLTSDEEVVAAACRQSGMIHLKDQADFLSLAKLVGQPPVKGDRLVVFSRSGGQAVVAAYACRRFGFRLPPLSAPLAKFIRDHSRAGVIHPGNPIDLGDIFDFSVYTGVMEVVCRDPEVDAILLNYGPMAEFEVPAGRDMMQRSVELARAAGKPLAITLLGTLEEEEFFRETLNFPVFHFPEEAIRALATYRDQASRDATEVLDESSPLPGAGEISGLLAQARDEFLPLPLALSLVELLGVPVAPWRTVNSPEEAAAAAAALGFPVVLKLAAATLIHKTEAGGVLLNLQDAAAVTAAYHRLAGLAHSSLAPGEPWQVVLMAQAAGGREVLLGARRDQSFGPVVAFGAGGIETEIMADVALRVAPIGAAQARDLMAETHIGRLIAGFRGQPPADLEALSRALTALSQLMMQFPQIQEVDLNPVRVSPGQSGLLALDARIRVG
ncbi:MAG: acetate--CoA ligase family protein [Deltaproteobacteria bacterium]|nr:acetate--CoA ligase family protein [Deltaproteobacteria bacterium]